MRRVTSRASFGLERSMFKGERTLLIGMALNTSRVCAGSQSRLFEFKPTVRIMAITTLHCPFENFVVEGHIKLRFHLAVTTEAKLRLAYLQHVQCREARLLRIGL